MPTHFTAILEQLTGASRGAETRLHDDGVSIILLEGRSFRVRRKSEITNGDQVFATLQRTDTDYSITVKEGQDFWINRRLVRSASLRDGDMLEFGDAGPMVRYHRFSGDLPLRWTVGEMAADSISYLRFSRKPLGYRLRHAAAQFSGRLIWQTTVAYRVTMLTAILALAGLLYSQYQLGLLMQGRIEASSSQLDGVAASLARARDEALKPSDLVELRRELSSKVTSNVERLSNLEWHSDAVKRVVRESIGSVVFLQLEFRLKDVLTGKEMRHVLNVGGVPVMLPQGQPFLSLDGNGPIAKVQLTGTGFFLKDHSLIATNRHVALPWERGRYSGAIGAEVLEPVITEFRAYFPNHIDPIGVTLVKASLTADLALLRLDTELQGLSGLGLAEVSPVQGEEVILLGYPTGLRSLLAQSGDQFVKQLQADNNLDFWDISRRLSEQGLILPLASRGITAQVASEAIVYDAETTMGGSGGPVLNLAGNVIAINAAILPEFGGSNLGVPVAKLVALIAEHADGPKVEQEEN
jgi:serine protease Do